MVWSKDGMVLTGETEVLGEKYYIVWVVVGWMVWSNGGMVLTGETEVLGEKHYIVWVVDGWMVWSNGGMVLTEETEVIRKRTSQYHFFRQKFAKRGLRSNPGLSVANHQSFTPYSITQGLRLKSPYSSHLTEHTVHLH
jgi:hypothetical protein